MDNDKYKNVIINIIECNELNSNNEEYFNKINVEDTICYLIDYNLFKKLKDEIKYEIFKAIQKAEYEEIIKKQIESNSTLLSYNIKQFDQINNIVSILNILFNNNEIILVNKELWEKICKEGKEKEEGCICIFGGSDINIFLSDNITLNLTYNNNGIITLNSFYNSNTEKKNRIMNNKEKLLNYLI